MGELHPPSSWDDPQGTQKLLVTPNLEISRFRKKPINDILTWMQCFTVHMVVLAKAKRDCITKLDAYMLTIITAAQDYEHPAWERYDRAYRDEAAATRNYPNWPGAHQPNVYW